MSVVINARGTSISSFQLGKQGPLIKNDTGVIELRDANDSSYAELRTASPSGNNSVATKQYVDSVSTGLDIKNAVRTATVATSEIETNYTYQSANDDNSTATPIIWLASGQPGAIFDGITLNDGDRVLIDQATDARGNGVFTYHVDADGGGNSGFKRSEDADNTPGSEVSGGMLLPVLEGVTHGADQHIMTSPTGTATLGVDDLVFTTFTTSTSLEAGDGIDITSQTVSVVGTTNRITVGPSGVDLASVIVDFESTGLNDNASSTTITINSSDNVGIGTASPDGQLHVHTATAGSVSASTAADDLVVENSTDGGISILTPNSNSGNIYFGDPDDNDVGQISYNHSDDDIIFIVNANQQAVIEGTANAVNYLSFGGSATGDPLSISALGSDSNIDIEFVAKGDGNVVIGSTATSTSITAADGSGGPGDDFTIAAGDGDTNQDGGDLILNPGSGAGTGNDGTIIIDGLSWPGSDGSSGEVLTTDGAGNLSFVSLTPAINTQTGTSYTLVAGDADDIVEMNNASANTVTIPTNSSVAYDVGTRIDIVQYGAGATTVQGDTGVTVNGVSAGSATISAQYTGVTIYKRGTDEWIMIGDHGGVS